MSFSSVTAFALHQFVRLDIEFIVLGFNAMGPNIVHISVPQSDRGLLTEAKMDSLWWFNGQTWGVWFIR